MKTLLLTVVLLAQPSNQEPQALLPVRPHPTSQELLAQADALYREANEEITRYEENLSEGKYKAASAREVKSIGGTAVTVARLKRLAERLALLVEPAGADLALRADDLDGRLAGVVQEYKKLPQFGQLIGNSYNAMKARSTALEKQLPTIRKLFSDDKPELAQERIFAIYDDLTPGAIWIEGRYAAALYRPFQDAEKQIAAKTTELRTEQAGAILSELRNKQTPPFERFVKNVTASADAIAAGGAAPWGGQQLDGPDLVAAWAVGWRTAHLMTLRARALDWAKGVKIDPLADEYAQFQDQMIALVAQVIRADAARATPDTARGMYLRYLDVLADLQPKLADNGLTQATQSALAELVGKSLELAAQVENYALATDDMLRWRRRVAARYAEVRRQQSPELAGQMQAVESNLAKKWAEMHTSTPALVEQMSAALLGKPASIDNVAPGADATSTSRYAERLIAHTSGKLPPAALAALDEDLLVTATLPPLTLAAALARRTAEQGYFVAAGGEVTGVQVDSVLGSFANLADANLSNAAPQFAWGSLPVEERMERPTHELLWSATLTPQWLQHEYVFAEQ